MPDKIRDPSLREDFQLEGQWWLPNSASGQGVGGILRYTPSGGLNLDLYDAIDPPSMPDSGVWSFTGEADAYPVIHGSTFNGPYKVTLQQCTSGGSLPRLGGSIQRQAFQVGNAYLGAWLTGNEFTFSQFQVHVTGMEAWLGPSGLSNDLMSTPKTGVLNVRWEQPDPIKFSLPSGGTGSIEWWSLGSFNEFEAHIAPRPSAEFSLPQPLSLIDLMNKCVIPMRDYSTFMMDAGMALDGISVRTPPGDQNKCGSWTPVIVRPGFHEPEDTARKLPLFRIDDHGPTITAWFALQDTQLRTAVWRLLARRYLVTYLENQLSTAAAAFEAVAGADRLGSMAPKAWSDALLSELERLHASSPIDNDHYEVLRKRLETMRGPSLQSQIEHVVRKNHKAVQKLVGDPKEFAVVVARARNKLGHGSSLGLNSQEAHDLVRTSEYILSAELAARIGVDNASTAAAYESNGPYNYLCHSTEYREWAPVKADPPH